jgi:hypothetical protein
MMACDRSPFLRDPDTLFKTTGVDEGEKFNESSFFSRRAALNSAAVRDRLCGWGTIAESMLRPDETNLKMMNMTAPVMHPTRAAVPRYMYSVYEHVNTLYSEPEFNCTSIRSSHCTLNGNVTMLMMVWAR